MNCPNPNCSGKLTDSYENDGAVHVYFCSTCHWENRVVVRSDYVESETSNDKKNTKNKYIL